ncbi:MAG: ATP-binding protein [Limisphaerales bacterium]
MKVVSAEKVAVTDETHIVVARQCAGRAAKRMGMGILDQTKIATATSELARNIVRYAKTGEVLIEEITDEIRSGLQITFRDNGPGIADIDKAMKDGFTTGGGMGFGLSGSKRLVNEFEILSQVGVGTTIIIKKWKNA